MKNNTYTYVDDDQNIVIRTDIIYTPEEFLQINGQVYDYAMSIRSKIENSQQNRLGGKHEIPD